MNVSDCCFNLSRNTPKVCWVLTDMCNLQCDYCAVKTHPNTMSSSSLIQLSIVERVVTECHKINAHKIILSGGEPLIITNIQDVVHGLVKNDLSVSICTNGTLLSKQLLRQLITAGISNFVIGIDFSIITNRSNAQSDIYSAQVSQTLRLIEKAGIPYKVNIVLMPYIKNKFQQLADWINVYEPLSINLIEPQSCGKLVMNRLTLHNWQESQMQEFVSQFANCVREIPLIFVSPRCRYEDCPSKHLVYGISSNGELEDCPWKLHINDSQCGYKDYGLPLSV